MEHIAATPLVDAGEALATTGFVVIDDVAAADVRSVADEFGDVVPLHGEWKYDVCVRDELANLYTARSFEPLFPHLDKYEWKRPPDTVGLYGRQPDSNGEGLTHVCDMSPFIESLDACDHALLTAYPMTYLADAGLRAIGIEDEHRGPALDLCDPGRPRFRYSYNYAQLPPDSPGFADLWERTREWYERHKQSCLIGRETLLLWRNTQVLHSRDRFSDPDRYLWRIYLRDRADGQSPCAG